MKRRHQRDDAIRFCAEARRLRPDVAFGADLIAGFPTESEDMFQRSLDIVDDCGLAYLHVFPFSPRTGTPAARMPQVRPEIVKERAGRLRQKGAEALGRHLSVQVGRTVPVLMERANQGRTPDYAEVTLSGVEAGGIVMATLDGHDGRRLSGKAMA
jgi:threonylcarbamoyladenosine tRNA methylthiotransferase MtaB